MDWSTITSLIAILFGGGGAVFGLVTLRATRRKESAGADKAEVEVSQLQDDRWKGLIEQQDKFAQERKEFYDEVLEMEGSKNKRLRAEIDEIKKELKEVKAVVVRMESDLENSNKKITKRDFFIRQAYNCEKIAHPSECPVLHSIIEADVNKSDRLKLHALCSKGNEQNS